MITYHPWRLPPLGAKRAFSRILKSVASGKGSSVNSRAAKVVRMTSYSSMNGSSRRWTTREVRLRYLIEWVDRPADGFVGIALQTWARNARRIDLDGLDSNGIEGSAIVRGRLQDEHLTLGWLTDPQR